MSAGATIPFVPPSNSSSVTGGAKASLIFAD